MFTLSTQHRRCRSITSVINTLRQDPDGSSNNESNTNNNGDQNNNGSRQLQRPLTRNGVTVLGLMVTAYQVRWQEVKLRIQTHPQEARQWLMEEADSGQSCTILEKVLSRRIDDYPPSCVAKALLQAFPEAVWDGAVPLLLFNHNEAGARNIHRINRQQQQHERRTSPLKLACQRRASLEILQLLTTARPCVREDAGALVELWDSYRGVFGSEQELVGVICEGGRESFMIYSKLHHLLQYCTEANQAMAEWRHGALHAALSASTPCSVELFRFLLQACRGRPQQADENGRLPLHRILLDPVVSEDNGQDPFLKHYLEAFPQSAKSRDKKGQLPLHLAITSACCTANTLKELIEAFPESLTQRDGPSDLYPLQLAATPEVCSRTGLSNIYTLLRAAPDVVLELTPDRGFLPHETAMDAPEEVRNEDTDPAFLISSQQRNHLSDDLVLLLQQLASEESPTELWSQLQALLRPPRRQGAASIWFPTHAAASLPECPTGMLSVFISMHPDQLRQVDDKGRTPLHLVVENAVKPAMESTTSAEDVRVNRLKTLLLAYPLSAQSTDANGRTPMHTASYQGMSVQALECLISACPDALCRGDSNGLYPFLLAGCSPHAGLSEVYTLLSRAPHVLKSCGIVD